VAEKGNSPFFPNHPVPTEYFVGRQEQLDRILERGVQQVARGKMVPMFVQGEYGIGKTSLASLAQYTAEFRWNIHPIYCSLGGCQDLADVAQALFQATIRSRALDPSKAEKISSLFSKYIGKQNLFGMVTLNLEALRADAPQLASPFGTLQFLEVIKDRLDSRGIFLVVDEINGLARDPGFAHFIKGVVDSNGIAPKPVPLLLMLCGVEECRREMVRQHQPIDRIFDIVEVDPMSPEDCQQFFETTFQSVNILCDASAADVMAHYSAGFPKIMQLIGDAAYWLDSDNHIDVNEAMDAVFSAAEEVGRRYVDQQVLAALRSPDYRSILNKIGKLSASRLSFVKGDVNQQLTDSEKRKFDNFLQAMKNLKVLRPGETRGEWVFNLRMVRLYIWLQSIVSDREYGTGKPRPKPTSA
jgi:hypothetical protein